MNPHLQYLLCEFRNQFDILFSYKSCKYIIMRNIKYSIAVEKSKNSVAPNLWQGMSFHKSFLTFSDIARMRVFHSVKEQYSHQF